MRLTYQFRESIDNAWFSNEFNQVAARSGLGVATYKVTSDPTNPKNKIVHVGIAKVPARSGDIQRLLTVRGPSQPVTPFGAWESNCMP
jgi:hypothetical protein